jgi:chemotaxis protein CheD
MNHFMLANSSAGARGPVDSARYGTCAMSMLIDRVLELGAQRDNLEAKVFGGGRIVTALAGSQVGERNARFVIDYLGKEGIPVMAQDMLDVYPRKVYFFPQSGRVLVKKLTRMHNETLIRRETEYAARLGNGSPVGDKASFGS